MKFQRFSGRTDRTRSIYSQWLFSYTLVLVLPVALSVFFYFQSVDMMRSEIERANAAMLRQTQQAIDGRLGEVQRTALQVAMNPRILQAVTSEGQDAATRMRYYNAMIELKYAVLNNSFVEEFYLFCNKFNKIITPNEQSDRETFYSERHATDEMSYDEWLAIIDGLEESSYQTLYRKHQDAPIQVFAYFQLIPVYQTQEPYGTLVAIINQTELENTIRNIEWVNRGDIYVLDQYDRVLFSNQQQQETGLPVAYQELKDEDQVLYRRVNGERMVVSYVKSTQADWKYVVVMPYNVYWENSVYINAAFFILVALMLGISALLIRYMARKNYRPLRQIMQNILEKESQPDSRWVNEYAAISRYLNDSSRESSRLKQLLEEKRNLLQESFLKRLLLNGPADDSMLQRGAEEYGIVFQTSLFAVVAVCLDDFSTLFPEEEYHGKRAVDIVCFCIKNVLKEILNQSYCVYIAQENNIIMALLSPRASQTAGDFEQEIEGLLSGMHEFFDKNMQVYFTASVSSLHQGAEQITQAHREALDALEYRLILGKNRTIFYTRIGEAGERKRTAYVYSIASEQKLMNSILNGDVTGSRKIVQEIFQQQGIWQIDHLETAKCLMYDLASTMQKIFNYIEDEALFEQVQPLERVITCETMHDLEQVVLDITEKTAAYFEEQKCTVRLSDRVCEYVNANYGNADVNVNMLGDHFGMAPSYLSKIFKKETGMRLLDYISNTRIDAAKHLLEDTSKSVAEISTQVGYIDSNAFILAFKRKEGITPGQYRTKLHRP